VAARVLPGAPASPGTALGCARVLDAPAANGGRGRVPDERRAEESGRALRALDAARDEIQSLAERLRRAGRLGDAELVETGAVMAEDPELREAVRRAVEEQGLAAGPAIVEATNAGAEAIARLPDATLAARADDVRSLGRRAARVAEGRAAGTSDDRGGDVILVASELGPADVSELAPEVRGIALAAGGVTAHAAIVARSLGIPMAVGLGDEVLRLGDGATLVVDGSDGVAVLDPDPAVIEQARAATAGRARARERALASRDLPSVTTDGRRVAVLVNAAGTAEVAGGLEAGADGIGLLRTELAFLDARGWPSEQEHRRSLEPVVEALGQRPATIRVLDFGGDKTPPFLAGERRRGIELLRSAPEALQAQLRAILTLRPAGELRLLIPMVADADDVVFVRDAVRRAVSSVPGAAIPALGAMIETAEAANAAGAIARECDFLSLGTNDLTCSALQLDRVSAAKGLAHHPEVLNLVARSVWAAREAEIPIEVCGEAASDPLIVPVLVGLGVSELSVGAARVGVVRSWIRDMSARDAREVTRRALNATSASDVIAAVGPLARQLELLEGGDAAGQCLDGGSGVPTLGAQS
jgi:phosphoenolpyruvate-protein kinase (PTS system EI component)